MYVCIIAEWGLLKDFSVFVTSAAATDHSLGLRPSSHMIRRLSYISLPFGWILRIFCESGPQISFLGDQLIQGKYQLVW